MIHTGSYINLIPSIIIALIIAGFTAYYAKKKGRDPGLWFFLGMLLSLFAILILYFLPSVKSKNDINAQSNQSFSYPIIPQSEDITQNSTPNAAVEKLWYYLDKNHTQMGPVSIIALREMWKSGNLQQSDYVWSEGMREWEKIETLSDLKEALNKTPSLHIK